MTTERPMPKYWAVVLTASGANFLAMLDSTVTMLAIPALHREFPASTLLGTFRNVCQQRVGTAREVLTQQDTDELSNLVEYANRFHHDTNPSWETEVINDRELHGFVTRTLRFAKR